MKSNKVLLITIFILSILLALTLGIIIGIYLPKGKSISDNDQATISETTIASNINTNQSDENLSSNTGVENMTHNSNHNNSDISSNNSNQNNTTSTSSGFAGRQTLGALSVNNGKLVDKNGKPAMLRGISTHGLSWYPQYVKEDTFRFLRDTYGVNVIRLAMYTAEYNGYCTGDANNRQTLNNLITEGINHATNLGMYVIVDWHILSDSNPLQYKEEAKEFFARVSSQYQNYNNIIYEICNEPNGGTSWQDIKSYANEIIPVIRQNDKDAVILVGTPNWSQYLYEAANSPLDFDNVMYTLHFYAATHKDDLRGILQSALNQNLPVFVSEFGICDASGNGGLDVSSANTWIELLESNNISYVLWNLSNKNESSAFLKPECQKTTNFTEDDLSDEAKWYIDILNQH